MRGPVTDKAGSATFAAGDNERCYSGSELEVFAGAVNWKSYFQSQIDRYIGGDVAEVGAGIGSNTALLMNTRVTSWLCIEPDARMARTIQEKCLSGTLPSACVVRSGVLSETPPDQTFDTILYIDVLEHIEKDDE